METKVAVCLLLLIVWWNTVNTQIKRILNVNRLVRLFYCLKL